MTKIYLVTKQYYFLAKGTVLKKSDVGDYYFVSMQDEDVLSSRIVTRPLIEGGTVEANKEHFLEVLEVSPPCENWHVLDKQPLDQPAFMTNEKKENLRNLGNHAVGILIDPFAKTFEPPIDYSAYQFGDFDDAEFLDEKPKFHKIDPPKPQFWPGAFVVSKHKLHNHYGTIPAGTIFQLDNHLTVNKYMKTIPCESCGVQFRHMFKGSREAFLRSFDFVLRTEGPDIPFTQTILLGDDDATKE